MPVRKTRPIFVFVAPNGARYYENRSDLEEDRRLLAEMMGEMAETLTVREIPLVMTSEAEEEAPPPKKRAPVDYTQEFESFWEKCSPKKGKDRVYDAWKQLSAEEQAALHTEFDFASKDESVLERLTQLTEEVLNGPAPVASNG
jgi:hypothetical protein